MLDACCKGDRSYQKKLYQSFYSYAMSISLRYATSREEAQEILNDSFLKAFMNLKSYKREKPFHLWLRRIIINTSIDYYRKAKKYSNHISLDEVYDLAFTEQPTDAINEQEVLQFVQQLPPVYRMVFNLHVIEGYKHDEIAKKLGIQIGTSKSNLAKARKNLRRMMHNYIYQDNL